MPDESEAESEDDAHTEAGDGESVAGESMAGDGDEDEITDADEGAANEGAADVQVLRLDDAPLARAMDVTPSQAVAFNDTNEKIEYEKLGYPGVEYGVMAPSWNSRPSTAFTEQPVVEQPVVEVIVPPPPKAPGLESLIESIDSAETKIALLRSRAATTMEPFNEILLDLCHRGHIKSDDAALLKAVTDWATITELPDKEAKHYQLITDLSALQAAMVNIPTGVSAAEKEEGEEKKKKKKRAVTLNDAAGEIVVAYVQASSEKEKSVALTLLQLHQAGAIRCDEAKLCKAATLDTKTVRWEDAAWKAEGAPTFVKLRDTRGRRAKMVFLGDVVNFGEESTPQAVLCRGWGLSKPSTGITLDAGTMHPRHCDEVQEGGSRGLGSLPKFEQFLAEAGETAAQRKAREKLRKTPTQPTPPASPPSPLPPSPPPSPGSVEPEESKSARPSSAARPSTAGEDGEGSPAPMGWGMLRKAGAAGVTQSIRAKKEADFKINDLIYDKMLTVFTALLDAATLSNSWIVIDRTLGEGGYSATAEYMLEVALERCSRRPTIIVIDSLQRLYEGSNVASDINEAIKTLDAAGVAKSTLELLPRNGQRSFLMHEQLKQLYDDAMSVKNDVTSKLSSDTMEQLIDFKYTISDFASCDGPEGTEAGLGYTAVPDKYLPFEVVHEHKNITVNEETGESMSSCDKNRKWAYFYDDSMFSSGTHYVIKNRDLDDFRLSSIAASSSYLYAHGDRRTCQRLRTHVQQGNQIVMLYNSGGISQIFAWLQRVMAHNASPPSILRMRDPLELLVAAVPAAQGLVGVPEMLVFQTLAERAPHLFRKNIVSVDLLLDDDEKMLQIITGCFSGTGGGMPELGLGNAEIVVQYSAWSLVRTLNSNARWFKRASDLLAAMLCALALLACAAAIIASGALESYFEQVVEELEVTVDDTGDTVNDTIGAVVSAAAAAGSDVVCRRRLAPRRLEYLGVDTALIARIAGEAIIFLPIVIAFLTTVAGRMKWRDKWSICYTASAQIVAEIYHFRMSTGMYNPTILKSRGGEIDSGGGAGDEDGGQQSGGTAELSRRARELFSKRCQILYGETLETLSDGGTIARRRQRVRPEHRAERENRYTFKQWIALKTFLEYTYYRSRWSFPLDEEGLNFDSWITGLRPYLERTLQDELLSLLETMENKELDDMQKACTDSPDQKPDKNDLTKLRDLRLRLEAQLQLPKDSLKRNQAVFKSIVLAAIATTKEERNIGNSGAKKTKAKKVKITQITHSSTPPKVAPKVKKNKISPAKESSEADELDRAAKIRDKAAKAALSALQGEAEGLQSKGEMKKKQKFNSAEDDYLVGALSIESYVVFRTRPILERLERRSRRLAIMLQLLEVIVFVIQMSGTIIAALSYGEWVAFTVTLAGVISERIAAASMREQLVTTNLSARSLQDKVTWWDAQTLVVRRAYKMRKVMVEVTEAAYLKMVEGHATAAAAAQEAEMGDDGGDAEGDDGGDKAGGDKAGGKGGKTGKGEGGS